jgi:hypothetical protein
VRVGVELLQLSLLYLAPLWLLALLLLCGRYPGERQLAALAQRRRRDGGSPAPRAAALPRLRAPARLGSGGAGLAFNLAGRGPP